MRSGGAGSAPASGTPGRRAAAGRAGRTAAADIFAPLGVRIVAGPLELRALTDDDLVELAALAARGVHAQDRMPFFHPWTDAPADDLARNTAQYHWRSRAEFSAARWELNLGVWRDGVLLGTQGVTTQDFATTRTGETGSWLGLEHQGRGVGTAMRQAMCAFLFDHLDFSEITSGAFTDNPASLGVSRKVGYRENGRRRLERRPGELAVNIGLVLTPESFVRGEHDLLVEGAGPLRRLIGLDFETGRSVPR
jgi:RimJ/RimL family protein N-acetyltransferase